MGVILLAELSIYIRPVALASGAMDAAVALLLLAWLARRRPSGETSVAAIPRRARGDGLLAAGGGAAFFVVKLAVLSTLGLNLFGIIHLVYINLALVLPGLALAVSFRSGRHRLLACMVLVVPAVAAYATYVEPFRLIVETTHVPLAESRRGQDDVRVAVLADLQFTHVTDYERRAVDRLMQLGADLILMPGDLFQGTDGQFFSERAAIIDLLRTMHAPGGIYAVIGDVDNRSGMGALFEESGIRLLRSEIDRVTIGDRTVRIGGLDPNLDDAANRKFVSRLESATDDGDICILLTHHPDVVMALKPGSRIDLVVTGHTHGGQVVIPGLGPPLTFSRLPRYVAAGGLHEFDGRRVYISRGVGVERGQAPRIRLFCPPEITLLTLGD